MAPRFPICNANEVIRVLRRNGFVKVGHADGRQVIVASHGSKAVPIGTLKSIMEGAK